MFIIITLLFFNKETHMNKRHTEVLPVLLQVLNVDNGCVLYASVGLQGIASVELDHTVAKEKSQVDV